MMERLALAIDTTSRKLRPYFQFHSFAVLLSYPLHLVKHKPSHSHRVAKWAVELSQYDIEYRAWTSMKSQVLANFLIKIPLIPKLAVEELCSVNSTPIDSGDLHESRTHSIDPVHGVNEPLHPVRIFWSPTSIDESETTFDGFIEEDHSPPITL